MEENTKKLEDLTVTEIKSLLYDQFVILQNAQNNINILQSELNKRTNKLSLQTATS